VGYSSIQNMVSGSCETCYYDNTKLDNQFAGAKASVGRNCSGSVGGKNFTGVIHNVTAAPTGCTGGNPAPFDFAIDCGVLFNNAPTASTRGNNTGSNTTGGNSTRQYSGVSQLAMWSPLVIGLVALM
jgi:hypothetical protein